MDRLEIFILIMPAQPQQNQPKPVNTRISSGSFWKTRRLISARVHEFELVSSFTNGYRNREDKTNLPPGVLIAGSQNVLTNVSERIQSRPGYALDGTAGSGTDPITASYTFQSHLSYERNLRAYGTVLEYRYVSSTGAVTWRTLLSGLSSVAFNFTSWWDVNELSREILMVNGTANIYEWGGGVTTYASSTNNSITKQGTTTWSQEGFYASNTSHPTRKVTINGVDYTYTGGENTLTLTGVTPDPSAAGAVGDVIHQTPITTASGSLTWPAGYPGLTVNSLIETFDRQLFLGSVYDQTVYVSKANDYKTFTTSSKNESGYGRVLSFDSPPVSINALENSVTISAGKNQWYQVTITPSTYTDNSNPSAPIIYSIDNFTINRLKTNASQAAQSQAVVSAMKNDLIFISNEPTLDRLGRVESILGTTQVTNISDPIKLDFDSYDFTGASVFYNKYFIYVAVPAEGVVRIFNIVKNYWEAPQTIPVSRFYTVNGDLYGHSSLTNESYQLFTGTSDNGQPINAIAVFSYQPYGSRTMLKYFNQFYVEGYIQSNTTLQLGINYDLDGCATSTSYNIVGNDTQIVCMPKDTSSLGKSSLGKNPLGGNLNTSATLPPHFQVIKTFPRTDFFLVSFTLSSQSPDQRWEVIAMGPSLDYSTNIPTFIKQ